MAIKTPLADVAHLLKRTGFAVDPNRAHTLAKKSWETLLNQVVDGASSPQAGYDVPFQNVYLTSEDGDFTLLLTAEMKRLGDPTLGLGDRMLWFWHGLLTSSYDKVPIPALLLRQHKLIARHALGNFRDMLVAITTDAAMLLYLDGAFSSGDAPNENYGRELMELFTLGRGHYQQSDVQAAARALSGWTVSGLPQNMGDHFSADMLKSVFDPAAAYAGAVTYLGVTGKFDVQAIIDQILRQDACAQFIAKKLFQYFIHPAPDNASIAALGAVFRSANFRIMPVLSALFRHPDFLSQKARGSRARFPFETFLAATGAFATSVDALDYSSYFGDTGQTPFDPPNVAGWPIGNRWLSASHAIARARIGLGAFNLSKHNPTLAAVTNADDPVGEALVQTGLFEVSGVTRGQLNSAARMISDHRTRARTLLALAVASPEFALV